MKIENITVAPPVEFQPVTIQITFESLAELLVLKAALGSTCGDDIHKSLAASKELTLNLDAFNCGSISYEQYKFFEQLLAKVKR